MNSEKVISNIKKAIKEHLDNNYAYDMLVDFELDVIDWNSLFEYIDKLQQENKSLQSQLKAKEEENKQLKAINKEYERLNKENGRGFKITNVQEYNIDELLSYKKYKDNWNKLKEYCKENTLCYEVGDDENTKLIGSRIHGLNVLDKMQELEQGSDGNGNN